MVRKAKIQMEKELAENAKVNPKKFWQYANFKRKTKSGIGELNPALLLHFGIHFSFALSKALRNNSKDVSGSFSLRAVFQSKSILFAISI
jgi:hypothetical protein